MNLVIVESPAKAKTIEKYLGPDFKVLASYGHVRDLPQKSLGVDLKKDYEPEYEILSKAKKTVSALKALASKAKIIYLATDLDREGEAISWHLATALGLAKSDKTKRIVFNEITKSAVEKAVQNPRSIDINLVDAQQARRVLDRLVGYKLSPLLWKKVRTGLSAGRVQSVAVRLVVEREREIEKFKPVEFWLLGVKLSQKNQELIFPAYLYETDGKLVGKFDVKTKAEAEKIIAELDSAKYTVLEVKHEDSVRSPAAPFTTSSLQMEASRKLGISPKQTMVLAQHLYEEGHITYMRTDSINLSGEAVAAIKSVVVKEYGQKYLAMDSRVYATKTKHAQEAHEAIRPTHFENTEVTNDRRGQKLYDLIWKRTVATQMASAIFDVLTAKIGAVEQKYIFMAKGEVVKFDGFMKVYQEGNDDEIVVEISKIPELSKNETLNFIEKIADQKFTEPPYRYSEATLVKKLESLGIGRPSTYAPTLETIQERGYVELEERKFKPTEIGILVNDLLVENFESIVNYQFTAEMEDKFDEIAEGKHKWQKVIDDFYIPFAKLLGEKTDSIEKTIVVSETLCPHCGKKMLIKFGRMGKFLACPEAGSKITLPLPEEAAKIKALEEKTKGEVCPICGKLLEVKRGRFGFFLGCVDYPKCKGIMKILNKTGFKCPNCKTGDVVEKKSRGRGKIFYACSRWPDCTFIMGAKPENETQLAEALQHWKDNPPKPRTYKPMFRTNK